MKLTNVLLVATIMLFASIAHAGPREKDRQIDRQIVSGPRADWQAVADAAALAGYEAEAANMEAALSAMTDEELYLGYGQMDLVGLAEAFVNVAESFDAVDGIYPGTRDYLESRKAVNGVEKMNSGNQVPLSPDLPPAEGYPGGICPFSPGRSDADAFITAVDAIAAGNLALEVAQGIWSAADRVCGTVAVGIGAVGNPQNLGCFLVDTALFIANAVVTAAEAVVAHIAFCDGAVDSAEIEGAYERAEHVHDDVADIDADLITHDANIDADLIAHDANIDADLIAHDENIDADLITHDEDIKELLANLQGAVDENQRLIKITMSRQQEIMRLLITPSGRRLINMDVLTCSGEDDDCPVYPALELCENGSLSWNCDE
jgi:hypothetical protein